MQQDRHDPFAALRQRSFVFFTSSRLCAGTAITLQQAAIAWQVYEISGSALQLGMLGLVRFLPALAATLVGGAVADSYDRRRILMLVPLVPLLCSAGLLAATSSGAASLLLIYGIVLIIGLASAFENPARQALLPQIVPRETFANAVTVSSTFQQLAFVLGPALGGLAIAKLGVEGAYAFHIALVAAGIVALVPVQPRREGGERRAVSLAAVKEGVQFVWRRQALLGAMSLDMFAVIFASASAMLPIYAKDILRVGPQGYGLLTASLPVGAFLMSIIMVMLPPVQNTGRVLLLAVAAFGLATVLFGLSRSFPLSLAAYALVGAADQVSVIMRQTTIQLSTPDSLRGRVSAVSALFISASGQIGSVESGLVAAVTNATFAVVSGGIGCLGVVGIVAWTMPELRRYRITHSGAVVPWQATALAPTAGSRRGRSPTRPEQPLPQQSGDS